MSAAEVRATAMDAAMAGWRATLADGTVIDDPQVLRAYSADTSAHAMRPRVVLKPVDRAGVQRIVEIARQHRVPLHPISSGRNWGYGSANAYVPGCAIVDLSGMQAIRHFDDELGLVTLEPGVTQQKLRDWLDQHGFAHMVPTTGAGPDCSLVGNALERGYGLTPHADHFGAVMALEAVLPDATLYRSPLSPDGRSSGFRWGVGPYLDGLFSQGNLGIVTAMTLALVRRPAKVETFYFWVDADEDLERAVDAVRETLQQAGSCIGGINLISAARFLAMARPGVDASGAATVLGQAASEKQARAAGAGAWMGVGAIYGSAGHAAATRRVVRAVIGRTARRVVFMSPVKARFAERVLGLLPGARARRLRHTLAIMRQGLDLLEGKPGEVALPLAYLRSGATPSGQRRNPAQDGCGLLWYAPIVAMKRTDARRFVDLARRICASHGFEAAITLSSLSERSFDCTLPILFDRDDPAMDARAEACWHALHAAGREHGFLPYRVHARHARQVADDGNPYWRVVDTIKCAVDPDQLISPGRWHD